MSRRLGPHPGGPNGRVKVAPLVAQGAEDEAGGKLTHVQPVGYDPRRFEPSSTAPYGVGAFLLAGSEVHRMVGGGKPRADTTP